jgi:predicted aspartyl protease
MRFKYRQLSDSSDPLKKPWKVPLLPVRLHYGDQHIDVLSLIDTGAADCLFDYEVGEALGIDLGGGVEKEYYGIAGQSVKGYIHEIQLQIHGFNERINVEAGFIEVLPISLLGQAGFFDNYQVTFMRFRGRFEVKSRSFLHGH